MQLRLSKEDLRKMFAEGIGESAIISIQKDGKKIDFDEIVVEGNLIQPSKPFKTWPRGGK